jgi:dihydrofolate reductase
LRDVDIHERPDKRKEQDMGKIVISENATLDGVISDPTGDEGTPSGGWFSRMTEQDYAEWGEHEHTEVKNAAALLLGGGTYRYFAERWGTRDGAWADRLRTIQKYVVSSTLVDLSWGTTTVLRDDALGEVRSLKERIDGEIVVYGSGQLVHTLWEHELVDELRVIVYPFLAGEGQRILPAEGVPAALEHIDAGRLGTSLTRVVYRPSEAA